MAGRHLGLHLVGDKPQVAVARLGCFGARHPFLGAIAAGHFERHARVDGGSGGVGRAPVGYDEALEAELLLKNVAEKWGAFSQVRAVHQLISGHDVPHAAFLHSGLEGGEIDFVEGALADGFVDAMALELLVVGGEVLEAGDHAFALHAADVGDAHLSGEVGVFAVAFEIAAPERDTVDVDGGSEDHVAAERFDFLRDGLAFLLGEEGGIPARPPCRRRPEEGGGFDLSQARWPREVVAELPNQERTPRGTVSHFDGRDAEAGDEAWTPSSRSRRAWRFFRRGSCGRAGRRDAVRREGRSFVGGVEAGTGGGAVAWAGGGAICVVGF